MTFMSVVGQVDDNNDNEECPNELVFYDDPTLNWVTIYEASSLREPIIYTRRREIIK